MKREILAHKRGLCGCCPGHDKYPSGTYRNRRSYAVRSRHETREHRYARTLAKRQMLHEEDEQ